MGDITRIDQNARRSRASVFGDLVFLAGQVADTKNADITQQTREALAKVDDMLARAGPTNRGCSACRFGSRAWPISTR
jgi:enamine deaminase RidA (YjgF/YER057c/UK114 family)